MTGVPQGDSSGCVHGGSGLWEEIGMKGFGHLPPLFINQWSN